MTPVNVIIWSCVVIFIVTAILTLLHISGIRPLPNAGHGKILFRALIIEIVVVAVGVFASTLLPKGETPSEGTLPGSMASSQGVTPYNSTIDGSKALIVETSEASPVAEPMLLDENCHQITVSDGSTFPPTSRIEIICNK